MYNYIYMDNKKNAIIVNPKLYKKMLCNNIIKENECSYRYKCMYAHSLDEQKKDTIRERAYNVFTDTNLSYINLQKDKELYEALMTLTNVCNKCNIDVCPGGYNCKYGAINYKYKICANDLTTGTCNNIKCKSIHLTQKGLIPYSKNNDVLYNFRLNDVKNDSDSDTNDSLSCPDESSSDSDNDNSIFIYVNNKTI